MRQTRRTLLIALLATVTLGQAAYAQMGGGGEFGGRGRWQEMRQAMVQACSGKSEGSTCSFSVNGRTINGTCRQNRRGELVCRGQRHERERY